jgi:hypothetical protein
MSALAGRFALESAAAAHETDEAAPKTGNIVIMV